MREGDSEYRVRFALAGKIGRVGYGLYSECFFEEVAKIEIDHEARIDKVHGEMLRLYKKRARIPTSEVRRSTCVYYARYLFSPQMGGKLPGMVDMFMRRGEFESFTVDSDVHPKRPLVGQL